MATFSNKLNPKDPVSHLRIQQNIYNGLRESISNVVKRKINGTYTYG